MRIAYFFCRLVQLLFFPIYFQGNAIVWHDFCAYRYVRVIKI